MSEAQRLKMVGGHFIWLWIDTGSSSTLFTQMDGRRQQIIEPTTIKHGFPHRNDNNDAREKHKNGAIAIDRGNEKLEADSNRITALKIGGLIDASNRQTKYDSKAHFDKTNATPITTEPSSKNSNGDFSQGFDPFRELQRPFAAHKQFKQQNISRDRMPLNRLVLGLRDEDGIVEGDAEIIQNNSRIGRNVNAHDWSNSTGVEGIDGSDHDALYTDVDEVGEGLEDSSYGGEETVLLLNRSGGVANKSSNNSITAKIGRAGDIVDAMNWTKYNSFSDANLLDFLLAKENKDGLRKVDFKRKTIDSSADNEAADDKFKDFPVGLLALRPIRMNIDRHFIRATIRVFASTWHKIGTNTDYTVTDADRQTQTDHNDFTAKQYISHRAQQEQRMRNVQIATSLYNTKIIENEMHNRRMRRKRNISNADQMFRLVMEQSALPLSEDHQAPNNGTAQAIELSRRYAGNITELIRQQMSEIYNKSDTYYESYKSVKGKPPEIINNNNHIGASLRSNGTASDSDARIDPQLKILLTSLGNQTSKSIARGLNQKNLLSTQVIKRQDTWWSKTATTPKSDVVPLRRTPNTAFMEQSLDNSYRPTKGKLESPYFAGGCYGVPNEQHKWNAENFAR